MKSTVKNTSKTKKKLKVEVSKKEVNIAFKAAYDKVRGKASIKGFRKGKVPNDMLDRHYKPDLMMEALNNVVSKSYSEALKEHELTPVLQPKFDMGQPEKDKPFTFEADVEVKPVIELKEYKGIPLKKKKATVEAKEIEDELKKLQNSKAQLKPVDDKATLKKGVIAHLDFEGKIGDKPFPGGAAKGYLLEYGQGKFLKEFEDQIEGMKKGEDRDIEITFPKDYAQKELADKKAKFHVTVQALHQKELPKLDDEFAKDLGKDNLETVKKELKEVLIKNKERSFRNDYAQEAIDYLIKKNPIDVPEGLVKHEIEQHKHKKEDVEKRIRTDFILETIALKESIKVEPQDIENRFRQLSMIYRQPVAQLKKTYQEKRLLPQLITQVGFEKTLDFVIDNATFK